jgi:hypothetical protein
VYQVRIVGLIEGQETNNVFHFSANTSIDDVELRLIAALATCFVTHLLPVSSSAWQLVKIVWKKVFPALGVEHETIPTGTLVGGGAATSLPSFVSAVVSIRTEQGGRSHRGRMYLPGIPEGDATISILDAGSDYLAGVAAFVACLATNFITGDPPAANSWQMQVYSRKLGGSTFPYGSAGFTPVSSFLPVRQLGTTRSRKVGRGS